MAVVEVDIELVLVDDYLNNFVEVVVEVVDALAVVVVGFPQVENFESAIANKNISEHMQRVEIDNLDNSNAFANNSVFHVLPSHSVRMKCSQDEKQKGHAISNNPCTVSFEPFQHVRTPQNIHHSS